MVKKEFTYRGKRLEELQVMSFREFIELLPSTKRRSLKREHSPRLKKLYEDMKVKKEVRTHLRTAVILPFMVGMRVMVYSGKTFEPVNIEAEMIGHRLGEFVQTRHQVKHSAPGIGATKSTSSISVK
jgi:small subunit ribosomal protein S19